MKKTITKKQVISALRTEKLEMGKFFQDNKGGNCKVCAVGAVLRKVSFEKAIRKKNRVLSVGNITKMFGWHYGDLTSTYDDGISKLLENKKYLQALSSKFEESDIVDDDGYVNKKELNKLIVWVKKNFPTKFVLEGKI